MVHTQFVFSNPNEIHDIYNIGTKILGVGGEAAVYQGTHKKTVQKQAVREIPKSKKCNGVEKLEQEIAILKNLDHPNIVKLYETFEDSCNMYMIMEFCTGGDLCDRINKVGPFSEIASAIVMRQIMSAVFYMHKNSICHRDLKLENILLQTPAPIHKNVVKVIDFGVACRFQPGSSISERVGTLEYMAPEVLSGDYNHECDLWSCGVLMYVLLFQTMPFEGKTVEDTCVKVCEGIRGIREPRWKHISPAAKNLIHKLLTRNPSTRCTAERALNHAWLAFTVTNRTNESLKTSFLDALRCFCSKNKMKKVALHIMARHLNDEVLSDSRKTFEALDANGDGVLSLNELKNGLKCTGAPSSDFELIMNGVDTDGNGVIDYTEFLAATLKKESYIQRDCCLTAFSVFDWDGDGKISQEDLGMVLGNDSIKEDIVQDATKMLQQIDQNGDSMVDFEEFVTMMGSFHRHSDGYDNHESSNQINPFVWRFQPMKVLKQLSRSVGQALLNGCSSWPREPMCIPFKGIRN